MKNIGIIAICLLLCATVKAQDEGKRQIEAVRYPLTVSYFGDQYGQVPGAKIGFENPLRQKIVEINNSNLPEPSRMLFHTINVAGTYEKNEEWNYFLNGEIGYRFISPWGLFHEYLLGAGVLATQPIVDDPGASSEMIYAGEGHVSVGIGRDFHKWIETNPLAIYLRATAMIEYPVADAYELHYMAEAGIKIRLKKPKGVKTKYTFR